MSSNQDPNSHIMYQPTYAYQATQSMGTWGQPPAQQAFAYTAYPQNDRTTYQEAPAYNSQQYPQMQYGGGTADSNADYYRSSGYYATQQATNQWPQQSYTTFTTAPAATQPMFSAPGYSGTEREQPRAGATSYAAAAQLPNMSRPPPNIKRDNGDNTFHGANLSMLETPAAVSAAYTATWVSNTSSIPPDLKEEPELFVGLATDAAVFPPNLTEQFGHLTMGGKNDKRKGDERRTPREEQSPAVKELTWQERINRANAQKERAEKRGGAERSMFEGGDNPRPPRDFGGQRGGAGGTRPQRGGNSGPNRGGTPGNRQQSGNNGMIWKNDNGEGRENGQQDWNNRGGNNRPLPGIMRGQEMPMMFHPGQAMMFPQRMPYGPPRGYMNNVQDERFKNTWLDVNQFGCPMPYGPMPFPMNGGMFRGGRGGFSRGRGGFGRGRGEYYNRPRDNNSRQSEEQKPLDSPVPASSVENVDSPAPGTPSAEPQTA